MAEQLSSSNLNNIVELDDFERVVVDVDDAVLYAIIEQFSPGARDNDDLDVRTWLEHLVRGDGRYLDRFLTLCDGKLGDGDAPEEEEEDYGFDLEWWIDHFSEAERYEDAYVDDDVLPEAPAHTSLVHDHCLNQFAPPFADIARMAIIEDEIDWANQSTTRDSS